MDTSPKSVLADGSKVTKDKVKALIVDELARTPGIVSDEAYASGNYAEGAAMFETLVMDDNYEEFLTLPAYRAITDYLSQG